MRDRKLRFEEIDCPVKGLRLFNVTGFPPLFDEMARWCLKTKRPVLDVQWWDGTASAYYQIPSRPRPWDDCIVGTLDVAFRAEQADEIIDLWSRSRYCVLK